MRIVTLDIETSPKEVLHFGKLWDTYIRPENIVRPTELICFAAKWYDKPRVEFYSTHHNGKQEMLDNLHRILSETDILITYNGKKFDVPHANRELLEAGFAPPAPYKNIDLIETMKRVFMFESNSLDFVSTRLGIGSKIAHEGMPLWVACMNNDPKAWAKMKRYNVGDVKLTEDLYEMVRPWIRVHPSLAHDAEPGTLACPACGGTDLRREGYALTQVSKYQRYQCRTCTKWSRGTSRLNVGGTGISEVAS